MDDQRTGVMDTDNDGAKWKNGSSFATATVHGRKQQKPNITHPFNSLDEPIDA
jgi:hypothetical protein